MTIEAILALIGGIALLVGIFGGGIEAEKIKIPQIGWALRIVLLLTGTGLMVLGVFMSESGKDVIWALLEAPPVTASLPTDAAGVEAITSSAPAAFESPTPLPAIGKEIAITEVMSVPCGALNMTSANEYIEIYNYGTSPADVNGWWLATNNRGDGNSPDRIVSWETMNPGVSLGDHVLTNNTIIPPSGYAVILAPNYYIGDQDNRKPYIFPEGVTLLTIDNGEYLGHDTLGLVGNADPLTVLVLYTGTSTMIETVISTYGTPKHGASPDSIRDNGQDSLPLAISDACYSVERVSAFGPDSESNWKKVKNGSPGYGR